MVKKRNDADDPEVVIQSAIEQSENFLYKNGKKMLIALGAVTALVALIFGVKYLYIEPREEAASSMLYLAQIEFANEAYETALNGDVNMQGFLDVIDQYSSTASGNIAKHYAGICYLQLGDYNAAIDYLSQYSSVSGGTAADLVNAQNLGLIGDANMQLGNDSEAIKMYEKAVACSDNAFTAPYYLKKAGVVYLKGGNSDKALKAFEQIKYNYPASMEARDIDKYIAEISK